MAVPALTSIYTPPGSCLDSMTRMYTDARGGAYIGPLELEGDCFPPDYNPDPSVYYSPATTCPQGYTTACAFSTFRGTETETVVTCCPSPPPPLDQSVSFTCNPKLDLTWELTMVCSTGWRESTVLPTVTEVTIRGIAVEYLDTSTSVAVTPVPGAFNAYGIQLRYKAADLESPEETSAANGEPTSPSTDETSPPQSNSGLSTGAVAGIAVGSAIGALLIAGLAGFMFWCGRRSRRDRSGGGGAAGLAAPTTAVEAGAPRGEPHGYGAAAELPLTKASPQELPGVEVRGYSRDRLG